MTFLIVSIVTLIPHSGTKQLNLKAVLRGQACLWISKMDLEKPEHILIVYICSHLSSKIKEDRFTLVCFTDFEKVFHWSNREPVQ